MLTIKLEATEEFVSLAELVKRYISASDIASAPMNESVHRTMYRLTSQAEIENEKKRHNRIRELIKTDEATGSLKVTYVAGNSVVLLDNLVQWADEKNIYLTQTRIRNRKTHLELADDRIQQRAARPESRIEELPCGEVVSVPPGEEDSEPELMSATADKPLIPARLAEASKQIPGKQPNIAIGKLSVEAAWIIECRENRKATDKEVMECLQIWADNGEASDVLRKSDRSNRRVFWVTGKSKEKIYTLEACQKTLEGWRKSRK